MSQFKTEPAFGGAPAPQAATAGSINVKPASVSATSATTTAPLSVLPTEPHPNPKPSDKAAQQKALDRWENEGGHPVVQPSREDIAKRAYEIYEESGCVEGRCEQNWHEAERELRKLILAKQDFKNKEE